MTNVLAQFKDRILSRLKTLPFFTDFPQPDPALITQPETSFVVEVDTTALFGGSAATEITGLNVVPVLEYLV